MTAAQQNRATFVAAPLAALALAIALLAAPAAQAQEQILGDLRVRAPGVVHIGGYWIHLLGVRGPGAHGATQFRQEGHAEDVCTTGGVPYQCGLISQGALARLSSGQYYTCELSQFPGDPRHWGVCRPYSSVDRAAVPGAISLNRAWVRSGWAMADTTYTDVFAADEAEARAAGLGLWAGDPPVLPGGLDGPVTGPATVADGNTLRVAGAEVRLYGIDAPELFQDCRFEAGGSRWSYSCGIQARAALIRMTMGANVYCAPEPVDGDNRSYGRCWPANDAGDGPRADTLSFNEQMMRQGWALADRAVTDEFLPLQFEANRDNVGMHGGPRTTPANWRRGQR